jgi:Holliday junction resolvase RusA-like endonuclease
MIKFTILGNPISSKNSIRSGITKSGRNYTYVNKNVKDYRDSALEQLRGQTRYGTVKNNDVVNFAYTDSDDVFSILPIAKPVQVSFIFYCIDNRKRDLINLIQCPADLLQQAGIIANDNLIINLDGSRIANVDKLQPRTEITITILDKDNTNTK